ncbi:APC family permease [Nesterenkonia sp. MY13]|uniref:APC family permease n=1 Tax=Nesterenkonia sedimenti TaxID=1463632 RepID=A0A7X8TIW9_9MICC|nr:APC family permease [Nesterenkonia sedimenti]NLS09391.1 APC family permease [Nesterenkonia sedimenti]
MSQTPTTLKRTLGLPSAVFFGLAYMVPLTVFTTYGIVTQVTSGHLPMAYIFTLAAMFVTALAYANMVKAFPIAGSAYTYTQQSFGPNIGFMAGWALLLDYLFLPMINFMVIGLYLNAAIPGLPVWLIIIVTILLVTAMNVLGIKVAASLNSALVGIQAVFILVFAAMSFATISGYAEVISPLEPFRNADFEFTAIAAGAAILCLSFLGFDAVSTLSEETKEPKKTIPRAIVICTLSAGAVFVFISWMGHMVFPDYDSFTDADTAAVDVMTQAGGAFLAAFFTAAYVSGATASAIASQVSVSRILFSMGRDGVLPRRVFAVLHKRFRTPYVAALIVGGVSLLALVFPLELASSMISFGALIAFSFVNLSVLKHYAINQGRYRGYDGVKYVALPVIGVGLCLWLWTSLTAETFMVGLGWVAVGFTWLLVITRGLRQRAPQLDLTETT